MLSIAEFVAAFSGVHAGWSLQSAKDRKGSLLGGPELELGASYGKNSRQLPHTTMDQQSHRRDAFLGRERRFPVFEAPCCTYPNPQPQP